MPGFSVRLWLGFWVTVAMLFKLCSDLSLTQASLGHGARASLGFTVFSVPWHSHCVCCRLLGCSSVKANRACTLTGSNRLSMPVRHQSATRPQLLLGTDWPGQLLGPLPVQQFALIPDASPSCSRLDPHAAAQ